MYLRSPAGRRDSAVRREDVPNVLIVTLSSVRADAVGRGDGATPHLDALAASGVVFTQAWAPATWSLPAHASLLTGLVPSRHGLLTPTGTLSAGIPSLPDAMHPAGYRTLSYSPRADHALFRSGHGLERGFDVATTDEAGGVDGLLREIGHAGRPWMALARFEDADAPYAAGAVDGEPPFLSGWSAHAVDPDAPDPDGHVAAALAASPDAAAALRARYTRAVTAADAHLGHLLDGLAAQRPDTVVIVTADHGEALGEAAMLGHAGVLRPEVLHVPLVVVAPGVTPHRVDDTVGLVDLAPTVLALTDGEVPFADGVSLGPLLQGRAAPPRAFLAQADVATAGGTAWGEAVFAGAWWFDWRGRGTRTLWRKGPEGWVDVTGAAPETVAAFGELRAALDGALSSAGPPPVPRRITESAGEAAH